MSATSILDTIHVMTGKKAPAKKALAKKAPAKKAPVKKAPAKKAPAKKAALKPLPNTKTTYKKIPGGGKLRTTMRKRYHDQYYISETEELDADGKRHGLHCKFKSYEPHKLECSVEYAHGVKHGSQKTYHFNNSVTEELYSNGKDLNFSREFNQKGILISEYQYDDDGNELWSKTYYTLSGRLKSHDIQINDTVLRKIEYFDRDINNVRREVNLRNRWNLQYTGAYRTYNKDGSPLLHKDYNDDGKLHGHHRSFDKNKKAKVDAVYVHGKKIVDFMYVKMDNEDRMFLSIKHGIKVLPEITDE